MRYLRLLVELLELHQVLVTLLGVVLGGLEQSVGSLGELEELFGGSLVGVAQYQYVSIGGFV